MKKLVFCLSMLLSSVTFASPDSDVLVYVLKSNAVSAELENRDIVSIDLTKENVANNWHYNIRIVAIEAGLGPNGPDTHPCNIFVDVYSFEDVAGNELIEQTELKVRKVCAMNSPKFGSQSKK